MVNYDIAIVGGGVGGATLAKVMAEQGYRVLIVERESRFRDRVRGELWFPWGVAEAKELGVYDALMQAGGHHPRYWAEYAGPDPMPPRDFAEDTPQKLRALCIFHPRMQETLLEAAGAAGAEVWRGRRVSQVIPGRQPRIVLAENGRSVTISARLVVGADGRSSQVRKWGGFAANHDAPGNLFTGVLVENVSAPAESSICVINPFLNRSVLYLPQSRGSGRLYLGSRSDAETGVRLQGSANFDLFLQECARSGLPSGLLDGARQAGPLATFDGADAWVEHPYREGITLIGDAAAASDPTWGQGLSLTLRDVRTLRDALLSTEDWETAVHAYASAHNDAYQKVRTTNSWFTQLFLQPGPEADALRDHVLPQMESDPFVLPDTMVAGPDLAPPTEAHRLKLFGR